MALDESRLSEDDVGGGFGDVRDEEVRTRFLQLSGFVGLEVLLAVLRGFERSDNADLPLRS
jgi:hypothetical protein